MVNLRSVTTSAQSQATNSAYHSSISHPNFRRPTTSSFLGNIGEPLTGAEEDGEDQSNDAELEGATESAQPSDHDKMSAAAGNDVDPLEEFDLRESLEETV